MSPPSPDVDSPTRRASRGADALLVLAWAGTVAAVFFLPVLTHSADVGDDRTRFTVRLALAYYGLAAALMPWLEGADWAVRSRRGRLVRWCWSFGWATYLVHLATAFHFYHHWSHADAVRHTQEVSGFGPGIFVSHLFTLAWTADVAWWWLAPVAFARRPAWVGWVWHGFLAFVIFNATVVYEEGLIRWAGLALLGGLLGDRLLAWALVRQMHGRASNSS
jgi:hypothetical protein